MGREEEVEGLAHLMSHQDPTSSNPPSGRWKGYYCYSANAVRHRQELELIFSNGSISGDGSDGIGCFLIAGLFDERGQVIWTKTYPGSHHVEYRGFWERKSIWGVWNIGMLNRGGFRIWPDGAEENESSEVEAEVELQLQAQ